MRPEGGSERGAQVRRVQALLYGVERGLPGEEEREGQGGASQGHKAIPSPRNYWQETINHDQDTNADSPTYGTDNEPNASSSGSTPDQEARKTEVTARRA